MKVARCEARSSIVEKTRASRSGSGAQRELLAGVRERGDRRERVVELVRDHADHLLPDRDFLRRHLARELLEEQQPVRLAVQRERPVADVEDLGLGPLRHREERVHAAVHGVAQRLRRLGHQIAEADALDLPPRAEELPRRDVAEDDVIVRVRQHERERRRLHDGVEQELALVEVQPLAPQAVAERVVLGREVADLVRPRRRHAHAEVAVAQAADAVGDRADAVAPAAEACGS